MSTFSFGIFVLNVALLKIFRNHSFRKNSAVPDFCGIRILKINISCHLIVNDPVGAHFPRPRNLSEVKPNSVMPDLTRHPEGLEKTGFRLSPE
jgi:hypothetical protein